MRQKLALVVKSSLSTVARRMNGFSPVTITRLGSAVLIGRDSPWIPQAAFRAGEGLRGRIVRAMAGLGNRNEAPAWDGPPPRPDLRAGKFHRAGCRFAR